MTDKPQNPSNQNRYADFISNQVRTGKVPGRPQDDKKPEDKK